MYTIAMILWFSRIQLLFIQAQYSVSKFPSLCMHWFHRFEARNYTKTLTRELNGAYFVISKHTGTCNWTSRRSKSCQGALCPFQNFTPLLTFILSYNNLWPPVATLLSLFSDTKERLSSV